MLRPNTPTENLQDWELLDLVVSWRGYQKQTEKEARFARAMVDLAQALADLADS